MINTGDRVTTAELYARYRDGKKLRALGRLPPGKMNKTEAEYAAHLERLKFAGRVLWYRFEGIKLRLADGTFYTVDFPLLNADCLLEMHEVKGHWEDDARVKIKVAADQYPFKFVAVTKADKRSEREWTYEWF